MTHASKQNAVSLFPTNKGNLLPQMQKVPHPWTNSLNLIKKEGVVQDNGRTISSLKPKWKDAPPTQRRYIIMPLLCVQREDTVLVRMERCIPIQIILLKILFLRKMSMKNMNTNQKVWKPL